MAEPVVSTSSPVLIGGRSAELADAECANRTGELQSASAVEIFAETIGERERKLWWPSPGSPWSTPGDMDPAMRGATHGRR